MMLRVRRGFIISSIGAFADLFRDGLRLLEARADGRTSEVVSREPKTREFCPEFLERGQAFRMSQIVLRNSVRVKRDRGKDGRLVDF